MNLYYYIHFYQLALNDTFDFPAVRMESRRRNVAAKEGSGVLLLCCADYANKNSAVFP